MFGFVRMVAVSELPEYTMEEVAKHANEESLWLVINGIVYDITKFATEHPGGEYILQDQGGKESTEAFDDIGHSGDAKEMMEEYAIGRIKA